MYVAFDKAQETAEHVHGIQQWITNEFLHSGTKIACDIVHFYAIVFQCPARLILAITAARHCGLVSTGIRDDGVRIFDTLLKMCRGCVSNFR